MSSSCRPPTGGTGTGRPRPCRRRGGTSRTSWRCARASGAFVATAMSGMPHPSPPASRSSVESPATIAKIAGTGIAHGAGVGLGRPSRRRHVELDLPPGDPAVTVHDRGPRARARDHAGIVGDHGEADAVRGDADVGRAAAGGRRRRGVRFGRAGGRLGRRRDGRRRRAGGRRRRGGRGRRGRCGRGGCGRRRGLRGRRCARP